MVDYAWNPNASDPSQAHFMIGFKDSQSDGGVPTSWPMLYNALWLRIFGYTDLLPNQAYYLDTSVALPRRVAPRTLAPRAP